MVAACLLKQDGHEMFGLHFLTGFENPSADRRGPGIQSIGSQLGIQVHVVDLSAEFKQHVVDYFCSTYLAGATPNPCMVCNPSIKFGTLLRHAQELGAGYLGHRHLPLSGGMRPVAIGSIKAPIPTRSNPISWPASPNPSWRRLSFRSVA